MSSTNLYSVLRAGFPDDLDGTAIETVGETPLYYTWRDIERATAMLANLLDSLDLPAGARIAVQADKSVESLLFYLAVLRAGHVYLPLNTAYKSDELSYFLGNAEPSVLVCCAEGLRPAVEARLRRRHRLGVQPRRRPQRQPARARQPLPGHARSGASAAATTSPPSSTPAAPPGAARGRC